MKCPQCGYDPDARADRAIQVNRSTMIAHFETWMVRADGGLKTERIPVITIEGSHEDTEGTRRRGESLEQLEAGIRTEGMVSIYEAHPAGKVERRRRPAAKAGRQPGR
jgi:hypothetical protein